MSTYKLTISDNDVSKLAEYEREAESASTAILDFIENESELIPDNGDIIDAEGDSLDVIAYRIEGDTWEFHIHEKDNPECEEVYTRCFTKYDYEIHVDNMEGETLAVFERQSRYASSAVINLISGEPDLLPEGTHLVYANESSDRDGTHIKGTVAAYRIDEENYGQKKPYWDVTLPAYDSELGYYEESIHIPIE
jgi:hypothetical protein